MQKKIFKISSFIFAVIFIGFFGAIFINNSSAQWIGPTAPPPNSNTAAPLDVGSSNQTKLGGLTLGKDLYLESGLRLLSNGGSNYGYLVNIADTLTYNTLTGGAEVKRFTIGNDGNVAIGNITPTAKLHVAGDIRASGKIYSNGNEVLTSGSIAISPSSIGSLEVIDGSLTNADIDTASIQSRVSSTCAVNSSIRAINQDGTVVCEPDDSGASYTAGAGISISGNTISATTGGASTVDWSELTGVPAGFLDGTDDTAVLTSAFTYLLRVHSGAGYVDKPIACGVNSLIAGFGCYTSSGTGGCSASCDTMLTGNTCSGRFSEEAFVYCMQF